MTQRTMPQTLMVWVPQSDVKNHPILSKIMRAFNEIASDILADNAPPPRPSQRILRFMNGMQKRLKLKLTFPGKPAAATAATKGENPSCGSGRFKALYWERFLECATFDNGQGIHVGQVTVIRATRVSGGAGGEALNLEPPRDKGFEPRKLLLWPRRPWYRSSSTPSRVLGVSPKPTVKSCLTCWPIFFLHRKTRLTTELFP